MLPMSGAHRNESGIVNLDDATEPGTHWVAYAKKNNRVVYFNNFDNLRSPKKLMRYFGCYHDRVQSHILHTIRASADRCLLFLQTIDACEFKKLDEIL